MTDSKLFSMTINLIRVAIALMLVTTWVMSAKAPEVAPAIIIIGAIGIAPLVWISHAVKRDMPPREDY